MMGLKNGGQSRYIQMYEFTSKRSNIDVELGFALTMTFNKQECSNRVYSLSGCPFNDSAVIFRIHKI